MTESASPVLSLPRKGEGFLRARNKWLKKAYIMLLSIVIKSVTDYASESLKIKRGNLCY